MKGGAAIHGTSSQSKTHSIESQEVRYRWHPWYGRTVWIHEDLEKNGEGIRRCRSENNVNARPLELPAWMFDEERCRRMQKEMAADRGIVFGGTGAFIRARLDA